MKLGKKFQVGGQMPAGGEDPMAILMQGATQAVQSGDCEIAMQVCQMLVEMAGGAPAEATPAPAPAEGEPVYRKGGRLVRRISK